MRSSTLLSLLLSLSACGARTGTPLDDSPPPTAAATTPLCLGEPGEAVVLAKANPFKPIAVDATHVYFTQTFSPDESPQWKVMRMPKTGGAAEPIFPGFVAAMVLSGGHVVIARSAQEGAFELLRVPRSGGPPETLATGSGEPTSLAAAPNGTVLLTTRFGQNGAEGLWLWTQGQSLKLAASLPQAVQVATSDETAYVVHRQSVDSNALTQVRLVDGSATKLFDDVRNSSSLVLDRDELFSSASFRVDRFTLGPAGVSRTTLGKGKGSLADLAVDATHVYFADIGVYHDDLPPPKPADIPGAIRRVGRAGGDVEVLSEEGREVRSLTVDACHVYWTSRRGLVRMRKPL